MLIFWVGLFAHAHIQVELHGQDSPLYIGEDMVFVRRGKYIRHIVQEEKVYLPSQLDKPLQDTGGMGGGSAKDDGLIASEGGHVF